MKRQVSRAGAYKIVTSKCTIYRENTIVARYGYDTNMGMSTVTVMHGEGIGRGDTQSKMQRGRLYEVQSSSRMRMQTVSGCRQVQDAACSVPGS